MSISDWSSDVCSSDLASRAASRRPCFRIRQARSTLHAPARTWDSGFADGFDERGRQCVRGRLAAPEHELEHGIIALAAVYRCLDDSLRMIERELPLALVILAFKSEEHTSELRHLIRISFAVFCLKKK